MNNKNIFLILCLLYVLLLTISSNSNNQKNEKKLKPSESNIKTKSSKPKSKQSKTKPTNSKSNYSQNTTIPKELTKNDEYLLYAAANGNVDECKKALRAGANVNTYDPRAGNSPLLWAAFNGHVSIIELLLEQGNVDIEYRSKDGYKTAILMATYNGHIEVIQYLISKGANINAQNSRGDTILHIAAYQGYEDIIKLLLSYDKIQQLINLPTMKTSYTSLHFACYKGHLTIMELLLNHGANIESIDSKGSNVIMLAILQQHVDILKWLILNYPTLDINYLDNDRNTALHLAIQQTCIECVHILIIEGNATSLEIVNNFMQTPLILAIKIGNFDMVKTLIMYGSNVFIRNNDGLACLEYANSLEYYDISELLKSLEEINL